MIPLREQSLLYWFGLGSLWFLAGVIGAWEHGRVISLSDFAFLPGQPLRRKTESFGETYMLKHRIFLPGGSRLLFEQPT